MARYRVPVIEMSVSLRVKLDLATIVEARRDMPVGSDRFDHGQVAIGDAKGSIWRRELNPVADRDRKSVV